MGRPIILGNSRLTVGLNEEGLVHDFYFPYVGLENLTTARSMHHKIGVWIDGVFSWTDAESWQITLETSSDAMIGYTKMINNDLGVVLSTEDFVDFEHDFFGRKIIVKNISGSEKEVRLFMHQVFEISRDGRADTAFYVPEDEYIMDFKGKICLLISGKNQSDKTMFDQFAVGNYGIEGKSGTYFDAEDGELSGHSVEHGGVDSVIRFGKKLNSGEELKVDYWIVATDNQQQCEEIHNVLKSDFEERLVKNKEHWKVWLARSDKVTSKIDEKYRGLVKKSIMTIKAHTDVRGGIIASCDSSIYNYGRDYYSYVWPRDGAYAMWPLIRLGYYEEPKAFLNFCADVAHKNGYLMHKYQPDRSIGSTWHPLLHGKQRELAIQEDETAIIIVMLGEFYSYSNDDTFVKDIYERFVIKAVDFLCDYVDAETSLPHASYDLWEEKFLTSTYTTACVYRALVVASHLAETLTLDNCDYGRWKAKAESLLNNFEVFIDPNNGGLRKGYLLDSATKDLNFDNTVDVSSFYGCMVFGFYPPEQVSILHTSVTVIENTLLNQSSSGGSPRYENDNYFKINDSAKPNPWIVTTLWLAQYYLRSAKPEKAVDILEWVHKNTLKTGVMPEQINAEDGGPVSVTPLVWSHAEYINTVLDLTNKKTAR